MEGRGTRAIVDVDDKLKIFINILGEQYQRLQFMSALVLYRVAGHGRFRLG